MERIRISVTAIDQWVDCKMKYHYAQELGLRPRPEEEEVSPTLSGSAIHFGVEAGMNCDPEENPVIVAHEAALTYLYAHEGNVQRYEKGVKTALLGVPQEYWESGHHVSEDKLEVDYGVQTNVTVDPVAVTIVGKPDIYFYDGQSLVIVDLKSSGSDEAQRALRYQQWNMQVWYYAALLEDWLHSQGKNIPPIYVKHTILSTRGKHFHGQPYLLGGKGRDNARTRLLRVAQEIVEQGDYNVFLDGKLNYMCSMCDFAEVDALALTGRDPGSMIAEKFTTREERNEYR